MSPLKVCILLSVILAQDISISILYSELTPESLSTLILSTFPSTILQLASSNSLPSPALSTEFISSTVSPTSSLILIDFTFSSLISQQLASNSLLSNTIHIIPNRSPDLKSQEAPSSNTLYLDPGPNPECNSIKSLLLNYNLAKVTLIYDLNDFNINQARFFKSIQSQSFSISNEIIFDTDWATIPGLVQSRVNQIMISKEEKVFLLLTENNLAGQIIEQAEKSGLGSNGYVWVLNSHAFDNIQEILRFQAERSNSQVYGLLKTGIVAVQPVDQELVNNGEEYRLQEVINEIFRLVSQENLQQAAEIISRLKGLSKPAKADKVWFSDQGLFMVNFDVLNVENREVFKTGVWKVQKAKLEVLKDITWPGGIRTRPLIEVQFVKLAFLCPDQNNEESQEIEAALDLAVREINENEFIGKGYRISPIYQNSLELNEETAGFVIKELESLGVLGYIGPFDSDSARIYAKLLSGGNYFKPIVSYGASSSDLSSTETYKSFLRLIQRDDYQATAISRYLVENNIKEIGLIYTNDIKGTSMYSAFLENIKILQISIKNKETKRKVRLSYKKNGSLSSSTVSDIDNSLTELVINQIKIIVFLGNNKITAELAKQAHQKELYGKYYAWFGCDWVSSSVLQDISTNYKSSKSEIMKVLKNSFFLLQKSAEGEIGSNFTSNFFNQTGISYTTSAMLAYDTVYLFAYAIKSLINDEQDFHDGEFLLNTLRRSVFSGASGQVMFRTDTNDRSPYGYLIANLQDDLLEPVLEYSPQSTITLVNNSYKPPVFYDGKDCPSDSWSQSFDCPFAQHMSKISVDGVAVVISIGIFLFLITLYISYYSYKRWHQIKITQITQPVIRSWKDNLVQAQILIEFFQFIAIAPSLKSLQIVIDSISNIFMLDMLKVANSSKQDYWYFLIFVSCLCYFWFFVVIIISTDIEKFFMKNSCTRRLFGLINSAYLPFIGNTMFLPFSSILFDAFVCDHEAQGKQYVWRDCYMNCWESKHIPYVAVSGLALVLFEPAAVFLRPLWQQAKPGLNIKIQPFFLLLKTCFQILLISVSKSLQGISPLANGIIFTFIISAFGIATYKIRPFNYSRFNLWEISSIAAICFYSVLATVSQQVFPDNLMWFVALVIGWGIILAVALVVQRRKMPNLMMSAVNKKPRRSLKDVISSHKVTCVADIDMGKSMNNSEFFKSKNEIENLQDISYNRVNLNDATEINRERLNCVNEVNELGGDQENLN